MKYLLDTDTTNYLLKERSPVTERFRAAADAGAVFILSPVVHYEITRYLKLRGSTSLARTYERLIDAWGRRELAAADWDLAAGLWAGRHRVGQPITDADLLIAVSAIQSGAVLVTNNEGHYAGLGVAMDDWARE